MSYTYKINQQKMINAQNSRNYQYNKSLVSTTNILINHKNSFILKPPIDTKNTTKSIKFFRYDYAKLITSMIRNNVFDIYQKPVRPLVVQSTFYTLKKYE